MILEQAIDLAVNNGIWAVMFLGLLMYLLKDTARREKKYIQLIDDLAIKFGILKKVDTQLNVVNANVITLTKWICKKEEVK